MGDPCILRTHQECSCSDTCKTADATRMPAPIIMFRVRDMLAIAAFVVVVMALGFAAMSADNHFKRQDLANQESSYHG